MGVDRVPRGGSPSEDRISFRHPADPQRTGEGYSLPNPDYLRVDMITDDVLKALLDQARSQ
jgi:hypothetical protein